MEYKSKTRKDYSKEEYNGIVKKFILFTIFMPIVYLLALAEGFFSFGRPLRATTLEFFDDWFQTLKLILGGEYKDNSRFHSKYRFKLSAKSKKFNVDVAMAARLNFASYVNIHFSKYDDHSTMFISASSEMTDRECFVRQYGKDEYVIYYLYWANSKKVLIDSKYQLSKEQVIAFLESANFK